MRKHIDEDEMVAVSGGRYYVHVRKKLVGFSTTGSQIWELKCNPYEAMEAMDGLIGKYNTTAEFDNACIALLQEKGWI